MSDVSEIQLAICRREKLAREVLEGVVPDDFEAAKGLDPARNVAQLKRTIAQAQRDCPEAAQAIVALLELRVRDHVQINEMLELDAKRLLDERDPEGALWDAD